MVSPPGCGGATEAELGLHAVCSVWQGGRRTLALLILNMPLHLLKHEMACGAVHKADHALSLQLVSPLIRQKPLSKLPF